MRGRQVLRGSMRVHPDTGPHPVVRILRGRTVSPGKAGTAVMRIRDAGRRYLTDSPCIPTQASPLKMSSLAPCSQPSSRPRTVVPALKASLLGRTDRLPLWSNRQKDEREPKRRGFLYE